ncbi:hypothetical protein Tco_1281204 [Tanacetum coccineum]
MVMGMMVAFIGDGGGAWRYGDDVGDDLDGIVAVWWLRQQGAAKVATAATGGRNLAGWRRRRRKIRRGGSHVRMMYFYFSRDLVNNQASRQGSIMGDYLYMGLSPIRCIVLSISFLGSPAVKDLLSSY